VVPDLDSDAYIFLLNCVGRDPPATTKSMKIHEYQGKELFRQAGVPVLDGIVATTPDEAVAAYDRLGGKIAVVKSQFHAGGRGKGTIQDDPDPRGHGLIDGTVVRASHPRPGGDVIGRGRPRCDHARLAGVGLVVDRGDQQVAQRRDRVEVTLELHATHLHRRGRIHDVVDGAVLALALEQEAVLLKDVAPVPVELLEVADEGGRGRVGTRPDGRAAMPCAPQTWR